MVDMAYVHGLEKALEIIEKEEQNSAEWEKKWEDMFNESYEMWNRYHWAHSFRQMVYRAEKANEAFEEKLKHSSIARAIKAEIENAMSVDADVEGEDI